MKHQHDQQKKLTALKKTKSLIDTMMNMIESDKYCVDIMQQNLAAIGLLRSFHQQVMEDHLHSCFIDAAESNNKKLIEEKVEEVLQVTNLYNK